MQFISPAGHGKNVSSSHPPPGLIKTQGIQASLQSHLVFKAHWRIQRFPQRVHSCYMCFCSTRTFMLPMFNLFIFRHNVLCSSGFSYFHLVDLLVIHFWIFFSKYRISKCIIWRPFLLNQIILKKLKNYANSRLFKMNIYFRTNVHLPLSSFF